MADTGRFLLDLPDGSILDAPLQSCRSGNRRTAVQGAL